MSAERKNRIQTIEGLRGLAALVVVFDHTVDDDWGLGAWSAQNHGVTVFAILSGFLLFRPFLRARLDRRPAPGPGTFLRARAVRIYPGYWGALLFGALAVGLHAMGPGDLVPVLTLTQTLGTDTPFEGLAPAWSLSMFMSFFLLLPLWSWWRARMTGPQHDDATVLRREAGWLLVAIAASWVVRTTSATDAFAPDPVFTVFGRADWFAIGMLLTVLTTARSRGIRLAPALTLPGSAPTLTLTVALGVTVASAFIPLALEELRDQLDTVAGSLLVAAAVLHGPVLRGPQRLLASRPAMAVGRWSFGIFLYGYIMQKLILRFDPGVATAPHLMATMAGAVALGAFSWRWVEQPAARRLARRRAPGATATESSGLATATA